MEQNWSEQLMNVINQIAQKLGVAVEYVYPVLRKQAMIDGIWGITSFIFFTVILIVSIKISCKLLKKIVEDDNFNEGVVSLFSISSVGTIISSVVVVINIFSLKTNITAILNPDWYIINNILKQLIS